MRNRPVKRSPAFEAMRRRRRESIVKKRNSSIEALCERMNEREGRLLDSVPKALVELEKPKPDPRVIKETETLIELVIADKVALKRAVLRYQKSKILAEGVRDDFDNLKPQRTAQEGYRGEIEDYQALLQQIRRGKAEKGIK